MVASHRMGLVDDIWPVRPPVKLVAQIVLAGFLIQADLVLRLTNMPVVDILLTLVWVVGITNAFNLLDNMTPLEALRARLADERAVVGVAGLGHVGLRRTRELARAGFRTTGIAAATTALGFPLARGVDAGRCSLA